MPGFDGTGPAGQGPMTGRGMGYCGPSGNPGYARPLGLGFRRGWGGRGRGRGFRNRFFYGPQEITTQDRIADLEAHIADLQNELTTLRQQNENRDNQR